MNETRLDCGNPRCLKCHPETAIPFHSAEQCETKIEDIGGTSDAGDIPQIVEFLKILNPKSILDIGCGCYGKNGYIARQYLEHKFRKIQGVNYLKLDAIEAYEPNANFVKKFKIYNDIFVGEALKLLRNMMGVSVTICSPYDVIMATHVLEHHTKEDGWLLLDYMYSFCTKGIILACPFGEFEYKDNLNPYQDHKSAWTPDEIAKKYPITTPVFGYNNTGHREFVIVIPK